MLKKYLILIIVLSVLFFLIGFYSNSLLSNKIKKSSNINSYEAGWEAAKKRLQDTKFCEYLNVNQEIKSIVGTINNIENEKIYIRANPLEPLSNPDLDNRIVIVNNDTKIFKMVLVENSSQQNNNLGNYPEEEKFAKVINKEVEINLSDLQKGDVIVVNCQNDIKNSKTVNAQEIIKQ